MIRSVHKLISVDLCTREILWRICGFVHKLIWNDGCWEEYLCPFLFSCFTVLCDSIMNAMCICDMDLQIMWCFHDLNDSIMLDMFAHQYCIPVLVK